MGIDQQDLERLVVSQQAKLDQYEREKTRSTIGAAIGAAINQSGLTLNPGAHDQLVELIRPEIGLHADGSGGSVACGPGLAPINGDFIKQTLAQPTYQHFVAGRGVAASPAAAQSGLSPAREILPGESLGAAVIRVALATRSAPGTDPRLDVSQPFGLRRTR